MSSNAQTPSKGRIVLFRQNKIGAEEWPAVVTRVHGPDCIDAFVMGGEHSGIAHTSLVYKDIDDTMADGEKAWRWPPRV